ncbi:uncharacterized protein LOC144122974 [Amblyomma americanum]
MERGVTTLRRVPCPSPGKAEDTGCGFRPREEKKSTHAVQRDARSPLALPNTGLFFHSRPGHAPAEREAPNTVRPRSSGSEAQKTMHHRGGRRKSNRSRHRLQLERMRGVDRYLKMPGVVEALVCRSTQQRDQRSIHRMSDA